MPSDFFGDIKEWSKRKHQLVSKYLDGFVRILGGSSKDYVYYVDGFAGEGIYGDNYKGSPVRAAELAKSFENKYSSLKEESDKIKEEKDKLTEQNKELLSTQENLNQELTHLKEHPVVQEQVVYKENTKELNDLNGALIYH